MKLPKLNQQGIVHLLPLLLLLGGLVAAVYLVQQTQIFKPRASVSGPVGGITYVDTKIGCSNPQGLTPDQICQQKGFPQAVAVDGTTAAKGYWWRQCGGASVSNCDRLDCTVNQLDCTNTAGYWGSQQPYPENYTRVGTTSTSYRPDELGVACAGYSPGWTMRVACSLSGGISGPITPTPSPTPGGSRRVFVTSTTYNGNLGGLAGADAKCQERASAANLGGTWKAWLSDTRTSASERFNHSEVPYVLIDGTRVADNWADLTDGSLQHDINLTELRTLANDRGVWTATNTDGLADRTYPRTDPNTCGEWSDGTVNSSGDGGNTTMRTPSIYGPGPTWTTRYGGQCPVTHSLYCFEQTPAPTPTPVACTINDLRAAFFSRRGEPKYNPACDINNDGRISVTDYSALLRRR